jgi:hypothetical protein
MLACFFSEVRSFSVLQRARRSYSSALLLMNEALQKPDVVVRDVTIATVLLLDLFEKFAMRDENFPPPATNHLQGGIAIFKLRSRKQFADPIVLSMFRYLSLDLLHSCLKYGTRIPEDFLYLHNQACQYINKDDYEWHYVDIMVRLASLKAGFEVGSTPANKASEILKALDDEYFGIINRNSKYVSRDIYVNKSSYGGLSSLPGLYPGLEELGKNYFELIRNLLDELLQKSVSCQQSITIY